MMNILKHTFTILPGVGKRLERHLWREGIFVWEDFLTRIHIWGISKIRKDVLDREITRALHAFDRGDIHYFATRLHHSEYWRLFHNFHKETVCLDIETTGREAAIGEVTLVGLYGRDQMHTFIKGINLEPEALRDYLAQYKLIITYYGRVFDIPFLHKAIPGLSINMPNYDLCFASHRLGIKGGLKRLEVHFGVHRENAIAGMDGYDAVILWNRYKAGDERALDRLIKYNEADTRNLYLLAEILTGMLSMEHAPFKEVKSGSLG